MLQYTYGAMIGLDIEFRVVIFRRMRPVLDGNVKNNADSICRNSHVGEISGNQISKFFGRDLADTGEVPCVVGEISYPCS